MTKCPYCKIDEPENSKLIDHVMKDHEKEINKLKGAGTSYEEIMNTIFPQEKPKEPKK